jgi:hypothetical protein
MTDRFNQISRVMDEIDHVSPATLTERWLIWQ